MKKITKYITLVFVMLFISIFLIENVFASSRIIKLHDLTVYGKTLLSDTTINVFDEEYADSDITFHKLDDFVTYKLEIENTDSKDYTLTSITNDNTNEIISYEFDTSYRGKSIKANSTLDIYLRVKYNKEATDNKEFDNKVTFIFTLVDENGEETEEEIPAVPITGDKVYIYLTLFVLALIVLLIITIVTSKNNRRGKIITAIILGLVLIPFSMKAIKAKDVDGKIVFNNHFKIVDKVKVTFVNEDTKDEVVIDFNSKVDEPNSPIKVGHTFKGWYVGDDKFDFKTILKEDIVLSAKYTMNKYNITYKLNGGNAINPDSFQITDLPLAINNPEKPGYDFIGWKDKDGNNLGKDLVISDKLEDLELEAVYGPKSYTITYNDLTDTEKASLNNRESYTVEDTFTLNNPEDRYDQESEATLRFAGWKDDNGNISKTVKIEKLTGNKTYTAIWININPGEYLITYNLDGGSIEGTNPNKYTKITETFELINPTKNGYEFIGWIGSNGSTATKNVKVEQGSTGDKEYTAVFAIKTYNLTYEYDGGTVSPNNYDSYRVNDTISLIRPTKPGYNFIGWTGTDVDTLTLDVTIPLGSSGDRHYVAHYEIITFTIDYVLDGGVVTPSDANQTTYTIEDSFILVNPTKEGNTFAGWTLNDSTTKQETVEINHETGDRTYTAHFVPNSYIVKFDKNDDDATGEMENQIIQVGTTVPLSKNLYTKPRYKFVYWTENEDGSGTQYLDEAEVTNLVLTGTVTIYAKWEYASIATFDTGTKLNNKMKQLANGRKIDVNSSDKKIKKFKYVDNVPVDKRVEANIVSISTLSDYPIYLWYDTDDQIIYYGSDADDIYLNSNASYMFSAMEEITEIDTHFKTDNTTHYEQTFWRCRNLEVMDVSKFNTTNAKNFRSMFGENWKMPSFDVSKWDVRKVENFNYMFNECKTLTSLDLTNFYTDSATTMQNMFSHMDNLTELLIPNLNTSKVTNMRAMFDDMYKMQSIDLSHFDTSKVENFAQFLRHGSSFQSINLGGSFSTASATNMQEMFAGTNVLRELDLSNFNTSKVTNFNKMFNNMTALKTIIVSNGFVLNITSNPEMFLNCTNIKGQNGTRYSDGYNTRANYAHVDVPGNPGYFTASN